MELKIFTFLVISLLSCFIVRSEFPEDPKPCKYGDTECIQKVINYILKEKNQGDSSLNLRQLQPMKIDKLRLQRNENSPVNIDLEFKNCYMYGFENAETLKVKGFGKDMTKKNRIILHLPYISMIADYKIDGKILILPIKGDGKSNVTMADVTLAMEFVGVPYEKDGDTYMKIGEVKITFEPKRVFSKIDNLFNGDKELGDNMNLFLNENWEAIYAELHSPTSKALADVIQDILNEVFSKRPYEKFFAT